MATTIAEICERAFYRIGTPTTESSKSLYFYQIESMVPTALQDLAEQAVDGDPTPRQYLTKSYTLTPTLGVYDLTASTDLLIESLPMATLTHASSDWPLQRVGAPSDLYLPQPGEDNGDFIYYAIQAYKIHTRFNGLRDSLTGNITVQDGVFQPVIAATAGATTLPVQLEDDLLEILIGMCRDKFGAAQGAA